VDVAARRAALRAQWDGEAQAFRCHYTGIALSDEYGSVRLATWELRDRGDESSVVLVAELVHRMKADLTDREFTGMVRELARHLEGAPFDETVFPADERHPRS
jgi:hypothetical protein